MTQVTARLPDDLVKSIDEAARSLNRSRAERDGVEVDEDLYAELFGPL